MGKEPQMMQREASLAGAVVTGCRSVSLRLGCVGSVG